MSHPPLWFSWDCDVERISLNEFWHARVYMATRESRATRREGRSVIRASCSAWRDRSHSVYEEEENSHCCPLVGQVASHDREAGDMKHNANN